jgi:hypothetical protein
MSTEIEKRAKEIGDAHAFPVDNLKEAFVSHGMSYRQWLVGMALGGLAASKMLTKYTANEAIDIANAACIALAESEVQPVNESPIDMLKAIVDHSSELAMDDTRFRNSARENAQYVIDSQKGGANG